MTNLLSHGATECCLSVKELINERWLSLLWIENSLCTLTHFVVDKTLVLLILRPKVQLLIIATLFYCISQVILINLHVL